MPPSNERPSSELKNLMSAQALMSAFSTLRPPSPETGKEALIWEFAMSEVWTLAICRKQTFYLLFYIFFSLKNDMLTSTYFSFF